MHEFPDGDLKGEDEALLDELRQALEDARVPPAEALAAAKGAFVWRTVDAELSRLVCDSARRSEFEYGCRSDIRPAPQGRGARRHLRFRLGGVCFDLEISKDRIIGQIHPPSDGSMTAEVVSGVRICACVDDLGCFVIEQGPRGRMRFTLEASLHPPLSVWPSA